MFSVCSAEHFICAIKVNFHLNSFSALFDLISTLAVRLPHLLPREARPLTRRNFLHSSPRFEQINQIQDMSTFTHASCARQWRYKEKEETIRGLWSEVV